jgi:hypothetical protein
MNTPALPPGNPPDYISIPEHLKSQPVQVPKPEHIGGLRVAANLGRLLQSAGIHVLGGLDGKRLSDFSCGHMTLWALREMIIRAVHPGAVLDQKTRPVPMLYWWPPARPLEVAPAAWGLRLKDVPLSSRLRGALTSLGIEKLGQLNGLRFDDLCRCYNFGAKLLAELGTLLQRAEAGEFALTPGAELASKHPRDYISIPEHLKSQPVQIPKPDFHRDARLSARLAHLLRCAGIRVLGDLHGKRMADFEGYCAGHRNALWALRDLILRAIDPGAKPDRETRPVPVPYGWAPDGTFQVAPAAGGLSLRDLPLSSRLTGAIIGLGIEKLSQLNGLPIRDLLRQRNCGAGTITELRALLRRAEAGEFAASKEELAASTPGDLLRQIDNLAANCLPEKQRALLTRYFGAAGQPPQTLRQIGQQHGVTCGAVGQCLFRAADLVRRQGGLWLRTWLACIDKACASSHAQLSPALISSWQDPARPFRYSPQFYVRLIARLRPHEKTACPSQNGPPEFGAHSSYSP